MTGGLIWFCASVSTDSKCIPMLIDILAQAAEVEFRDNGNAASHFDTALPAGKITKLAIAVAEIAKVDQPFSSFDGKHREVGKEFYTRVSERLRHKGRAINAWDYEHLILNRFPSIYKVKCITHADPNCYCRPAEKKPVPDDDLCCGPQIAPGHVLIIPIADLKNRNAVNPLQPKTSRRTIIDIEKYIKARTSPFVKVHVRNPLYEEVLVQFKVKFHEGFDKGFHLKKLNQEIVEYLTPWAFHANREVKFGQKIYASSVINFIEERPYVDFIVDFLMFVCRDECCPPAIISKPEKPVQELKVTAEIKVVSALGKPQNISGIITDTESGKGIKDVLVFEKGVKNNEITDADGKFSLIVTGDGKELIFQIEGYQPEIVSAEADKKIDLSFKQKQIEKVIIYNRSGIVPDTLDRNCGCSEIDYVLDKASFVGETVVTPSTQRSILVSVPQHIIIPFEEDPRPSLCDERKKLKSSSGIPDDKKDESKTGKKTAPKKRIRNKK